jgi:hypothetical protein
VFAGKGDGSQSIEYQVDHAVVARLAEQLIDCEQRRAQRAATGEEKFSEPPHQWNFPSDLRANKQTNVGQTHGTTEREERIAELGPTSHQNVEEYHVHGHRDRIEREEHVFNIFQILEYAARLVAMFAVRLKRQHRSAHRNNFPL